MLEIIILKIIIRNLLAANKNVIISSPAISGPKVYELIDMLKEKQTLGVQVTIVTWTPDSYGYGDAAYWMQLHEDMRKQAFISKRLKNPVNDLQSLIRK